MAISVGPNAARISEWMRSHPDATVKAAATALDVGVDEVKAAIDGASATKMGAPVTTTNLLRGDVANEARLPGRDLYGAQPTRLTAAQTRDRLATTARSMGVDERTIKRALAGGIDANALGLQVLKATDLTGADLSGLVLDAAGGETLDLAGMKLAGADLSGAQLRGVNLDGAELTGANLQGASLLESSLKGASLDGANLKNAQLGGSDLGGASLQKADLSGSVLSSSFAGAKLKGATLDGALFDGEASFRGADLGAASLRGVKVDTFASVDFQGAKLAGAVIDGLELKGKTDFSGADATGATLRIDWKAESRAESKFASAKLDGAELTLRRDARNDFDDGRIREALSHVELGKANVDRTTVVIARAGTLPGRDLHVLKDVTGATGPLQLKVNGAPVLGLSFTDATHVTLDADRLPPNFALVANVAVEGGTQSQLYRLGDVTKGEPQISLVARVLYGELTRIDGAAGVELS